jgi:hypothetical protein
MTCAVTLTTLFSQHFVNYSIVTTGKAVIPAPLSSSRLSLGVSSGKTLEEMQTKVVNLGMEIVNEEIEQALELYPDEPYKKAFASPELRQKLISYVMNKIQEAYSCVEKTPNRPQKLKFPYRSLELRLHIENYVHRGIDRILQVNSNLARHSFTQDAQPDYTPNGYFSRFWT